MTITFPLWHNDGRSIGRSPPSPTEGLPLRPTRTVLPSLLITATLLAGVLGHPGVASASSPPESPSHKAARLRAEAARVQGTVDRMNDQVEGLVERYDANQEALGRTASAQADTKRRIEEATRALSASQAQLDRRAWDAYTTGPVNPLAALLGAATIQDALTTAKYQERVIAADGAAVARIHQGKHDLETLAAQLNAQHRAEEQLKAKLGGQRQQIEADLARQHAYLAQLNQGVKRALAEQRRREEALARQALARRLAAARAAQRAAHAAHSNAAPYVQRHAGTGAAGPDAGGRAVGFALAQVGKPYVWGAVGPNSYDCSGLTSTAYGHADVAIPRTAAEQWWAGSHVSMSQLQPGDLVFYAFNTSNPSTIHHVGMYIGKGEMVEAPHTGADVRVASIGRADYIGATRPTG